MAPNKKNTYKVEVVPVDLLKPHPMNPRRGDVDAIVQSIRVNGFYGTLVVQKSTNYILAGNHRWQAAKQAGLDAVPVMWMDVTNVQAKKILLADNRINDLATYATDDLQTLLRSVLAEDDLRGTGYDVTDVQQMIEDIIDEPNDKRVRNLEPFHHAFFLVKVPVTEQGRVNSILEAELGGIEGIEFASATN